MSNWKEQYPKLGAYLDGMFDESSASRCDVLLASDAEAAKAEAELEDFPIQLVRQMGYYDLVCFDSDPTGKGKCLIETVRELGSRYL